MREARDARLWQIVALSALLAWNIAGLSLGAALQPSLVAVAVSLAAEAAAARLAGRAGFDPRSPLITGLSLSLLLRGDALWIPTLAALLAIGSKFLLRVDGRHIWNPAAFGIVVLLQTGHAWVSPGQWGNSAFFTALLAFAGILVLSRAARLDTTLAFLGAHALLLLARAAWLGDPPAIPLHQLESGALLLFAFFMITDPRTTPATRGARIGFAAGVALLAHGLWFGEQMRPALYVALFTLAPLVPLLDRLMPSAQIPGEFAMSHRLRAWARQAGIALSVGALATASVAPAYAFCGFYVAQADGRLFNKSSKVVLAWDDGKASVTMASDYEGDPKEFALVVPVPTIVAKDDIHVVEPHLIDKLDSYSAPRLTEYFDKDPCNPPYQAQFSAAVNSPARAARPEAGEASPSVTIEARYEVGVYDILILAAEESEGLAAWLQDNGYRIPEGAAPVLGSYIRQGMHFFVAKVNLDRQASAGERFLRPLQVSYRTKKFMLPIRLGTANASGPQDMIVFVLSRHGRVETTNYQTVKMPSGLAVPLFAKNEFGKIYKAAYERRVAIDGMRNVYLEYAWEMGNGFPCDPCAAPVPQAPDLFVLGAHWLYPEYADAGMDALKGARLAPKSPDAFLTRLHVRYTAERFPEDLSFTETRDRGNFQTIYKLQHPWLGVPRCKEAEDYRRSLPARFEGEADNLAWLTGWGASDLREKMQQNGEPFDLPPHP